MLRLPREGRAWLKELQTVRNKWAHLPSEAMPASEVYRDADTLGHQEFGTWQTAIVKGLILDVLYLSSGDWERELKRASKNEVRIGVVVLDSLQVCSRG